MKKSHLQLLSNFADASDELFKLKIIRADSFTGEIGEHIASKQFNLELKPKSEKEVDATDSNGQHYQVKSKIATRNNFGYRISGLNPKAFKYLVVVYFDELYKPLKILKIDSKVISGSEYYIPANVTANQNISVIEGNSIKVSPNAKRALAKFAETFNLLKTHKIVRTRNIVGDLGESYACEKLGLKINEKSNTKGIDAIHPSNGLTFEVKTRHVYLSERRKSDSRRINGLIGKSADYLVVVTLNREFRCSGMWIMPMKNIVNPKSAHLTIVNNTKGVESVVPSQVDWLKTANKFRGFGNKKRAVSKSVVPDSDTKNSSLAKSNSKTKAQVNSNRRKYSWMADDHWDNVEPHEKPIENPYPIYPKPKPFSKAEAILRQINGFMWFLLFAIFFFSIMFRGCF